MLRVAQQERRLAELERSAPTSDALSILAAFKQTLQEMIDRRKEILLSLGKQHGDAASDARQTEKQGSSRPRLETSP